MYNSPRRYKLLEQIGSGGFGTVYRGEVLGASDFRKQVAIKLLREDCSEEDLSRLRDEARLLGLIRHSSVVAAEDLVQLDGRWAVVMEFIEGRSLDTLPPLPTRAAAELVREVAAALAAIHTACHPDTGKHLGLIHRDIKPSNIMVTSHGEVRLIDFGIARGHDSFRETSTRNVRYGSPGYLAPERILGQPDTTAVDIYALGVVLFETLTGARMPPLPNTPRAHALACAEMLEEASLAEPLWELQEAVLTYEPIARPDARALAEALASLSGRLPGASLYTWARDTLSSCSQPTHTSQDAASSSLQHTAAETGSSAMWGGPTDPAEETVGDDIWSASPPPEPEVTPPEPEPAPEPSAPATEPAPSLSQTEPAATKTPLRAVAGLLAAGIVLAGGFRLAQSPLSALPTTATADVLSSEPSPDPGSHEVKAEPVESAGPAPSAPPEPTPAPSEPPTPAPEPAPEPEAAPAPEPAPSDPAPEPEAEAAPVPSVPPAPLPTAAPVAEGRLLVTGAASFQISSGGRTWSPGTVPAGHYTLEVVLVEGQYPLTYADIEVASGEEVLFTCNAGFDRCSERRREIP